MIIENKTMNKSDAQKLLEISEHVVALQRQMHDILKNGSLDAASRQQQKSVLSVQKSVLTVLQPEFATEQVGRMLEIFRKSVGRTQVQIANEMGTSQKQVSKLEKGPGNPTIASIVSYAETAGGEVTFLMGPKSY